MKALALRGINYVQTVQDRGQGYILWHPYSYFPGRWKFRSCRILNFLLERNELISIIKLAGNSNLDNLCNKAGYQVVSKAFSYPRIPQSYAYCLWY